MVLHAGYNHVDNLILDRENFASIGIGFQWRLFDSGQLQARTSALRSRAHAAEQRLADLRSQVTLEVETAFYNREEAAGAHPCRLGGRGAGRGERANRQGVYSQRTGNQ